MAGLNKVMLIGNAVADGELRYSKNGSAILSFRLGVTVGKDEPQFFNIVYFGEVAEKVAPYVTKGTSVFVEGRLNNRSWEDDKGQKRTSTDINVFALQLLGGGNRNG